MYWKLQKKNNLKAPKQPLKTQEFKYAVDAAKWACKRSQKRKKMRKPGSNSQEKDNMRNPKILKP